MEIFVCKFNMLKKCKIKTKKNKKGNKKKQGEKPKKQAKKQNTQKCILLFLILTQMIPRAMLACTKPARADKRRRSRSVETRAEVSRPSIIITKEVHYENVELQ